MTKKNRQQGQQSLLIREKLGISIDQLKILLFLLFFWCVAVVALFASTQKNGNEETATNKGQKTFYISRPASPAVLAHRAGQINNNHVHRLLSAGHQTNIGGFYYDVQEQAGRQR